MREREGSETLRERERCISETERELEREKEE